MRIVIKIGTSTLAHKSGRLNIRHTEELVKTISDLKNAGHEIILVSSGAIGMGSGKLGFQTKPSDMPSKQAAASVGQCELMYTYDRLFGEYNHTVGQILVTADDFESPDRLMNLENTIFRLLTLQVIPIINENDSVSTAEISIGDNDTMGALVAKYMQADLCVILSDIDGLFTADPHTHPEAELISVVSEITPEIDALAGGAGSDFGTGGMATKLTAARIAVRAGVDMVIANGANAAILYDIVEGKKIGTRFLGKR